MAFLSGHVIGSFPRTLRQDIELVKLDYQINQSNHFSAVGNIRDWKQPTSLLADGIQNGGSQGTSYLQDRFVIATLNTVIGNNKVNELRYQYGVDNSFSDACNTTVWHAPGGAQQLSPYGQNGGSGHTDGFRNQMVRQFLLDQGHAHHQVRRGHQRHRRQCSEALANSGGLYSLFGCWVCPAWSLPD